MEIENKSYKIGIVGHGFVGKATRMFECHDIQVLIYDIDPSKSTVKHLSELSLCDVIFICLPTPMKPSGEADTSLISKTIKQLKAECPNSEYIIRSTVPVGFSESVGASFMPEFLTEANWQNDFFNCENWFFGKNPASNFNFPDFLFVAWRNKKICNYSYSILSTKEAETIKYIRNAFLATKVSFFNEIYDLCKGLNIDYDTVSKLAAEDSRIGISHIKVPGFDGKRGFSGSCFPKDLASLIFQGKQLKIRTLILDSVKTRNITIDRPERDWENLKGRAVI